MKMKRTKTKNAITAGLLGFGALLGGAKADALNPVVDGNPKEAPTERVQDITDSFRGVTGRIAIQNDNLRRKEKVLETVTVGGKEYQIETTKKSNFNYPKLTLGAGWGDKSWNDEFFRAYLNWDNNGEDTKTWTEAAFRHDFEIGGLENNMMIFGSFGDVEGIGMQTQHKYNGHSLTLNAEKALRNEGVEPSRLGAALDVKLTDRFTLGGAVDVKKDEKGRSNFYQIRGMVDLTQTDLLGVSYLMSDEAGEVTHSGIISWGHYGEDEKWGTTMWGRYDHGENGSRGGRVELQLMQNPNFGSYNAIVPISRDRGDILFHADVVANALDFEVPPIAGYSHGGWVAELDASFREADGGRSGQARLDAGYVFKINEDTTLSVVPYGETFFGDIKGHGYGIDFLFGRPDLFAEVTLSRTKVEDTEDMGVFFYVGKTISAN